MMGAGSECRTDGEGERVSVVATVRNEAAGIRAFVDSLLAQSHPPDELIVVDGASTDGTREILAEYEAAGRLVLVSQDCNIAQGRNIGIARATSGFIAVTDAGCTAERDWLRNLVRCHRGEQRPDVVAGNYSFETHTAFEEASVLATDSPDRESSESAVYYPSSRSIAFTKAAWQAVKGYPDWLYAAEDTLFNIRLRQLGFRFAFCREAIVRWRPRTTWRSLFRQYFNYARGNGRIGGATGGYVKNLRTHSLVLVLLVLGLAWWPLALGALLVAADHVRGNYWRQARAAQRATGKVSMLWRVLGVMEFVRIAGMCGFVAGRYDRWRDPSFIAAQRAWMGTDTVQHLYS
jgi:glycosyltransferase involved in cell wall biosynthesis